MLIRPLWQLKTVVFLHWGLIRGVLLLSLRHHLHSFTMFIVQASIMMIVIYDPKMFIAQASVGSRSEMQSYTFYKRADPLMLKQDNI